MTINDIAKELGMDYDRRYRFYNINGRVNVYKITDNNIYSFSDGKYFVEDPYVALGLLHTVKHDQIKMFKYFDPDNYNDIWTLRRDKNRYYTEAVNWGDTDKWNECIRLNNYFLFYEEIADNIKFIKEFLDNQDDMLCDKEWQREARRKCIIS